MDATLGQVVEKPVGEVAGSTFLLARLSAGIRAAIWSGTFLAYFVLLGLLDKATTTLALLGIAARLSIAVRISLGMFRASRPRTNAFFQPITDFLQTLPSFGFMVPEIACFGTGKPAAVVTAVISGGTPVVGLSILGLRGVP